MQGLHGGIWDQTTLHRQAMELRDLCMKISDFMKMNSFHCDGTQAIASVILLSEIQNIMKEQLLQHSVKCITKMC